MPLKAAVRFRLRDGSTFEKALPLSGEVRIQDVAPAIGLLAQPVVRHVEDPWIEVAGGGCVKAKPRS
ncbi:MAG TPA: hypothetical protein VNB86_03825 [Gaiellaceae bacterium]|jgi:hypothetical protein|nr:hypothetical protein [Gaiellaceae bacterium]